MARQLPFIKLKGKPEEIGWQHGSQIKDRIRDTWQLYSQGLPHDKPEYLKELGNKYLQKIYDFSEPYGKEIEAIAAASNHKSWEIAVLNARTEIIQRLFEENPIGECTVAYLPNTGILGQNWDWVPQLEQLIVLMELEREDGHKILQFTEPGIIGKIGFNSKGIGVCFNFISGGASPISVPIHILNRTVLDSHSILETFKMFEEMQHGTINNILMADDSGQFIDVEFCREEMKVVKYEDPVPLHTNHYLSDFADDHDFENDVGYPSSLTRYNKGRELLNCLDSSAGVSELKTVLMDQSHDQYPICAPYTDYSGLQLGTVCSVIMDLPKRTMEFSLGKPSENTYNTFVLN